MATDHISMPFFVLVLPILARASTVAITNVEVPGFSTQFERSLYIDVPTDFVEVNFINVSFKIYPGAEVDGDGSLLIFPEGSDIKYKGICIKTPVAIHKKFAWRRRFRNVTSKWPVAHIPLGPPIDFSIVISETGAYVVAFVNCGKSDGVFNLLVSSSNLGPKQTIWHKMYAGFLGIYACVCSLWFFVIRGMKKKPVLAVDISMAAVFSLGMALCGVLHHAPDRKMKLEWVFVITRSVAVASLVAAMFTATTTACSAHRIHDVIRWSLITAFTFATGIELRPSIGEYNGPCGSLPCGTSNKSFNYPTWQPLAGVTAFFVAMAAIFLIRSMKSCVEEDAWKFKVLALVIGIYLAFGASCVWLRHIDEPGVGAEWFSKHRDADVVRIQIAQAFGLVAMVVLGVKMLPSGIVAGGYLGNEIIVQEMESMVNASSDSDVTATRYGCD